MGRLDYPFNSKDLKYADNLIANFAIILFVIAILVFKAFIIISSVIIIKGSGYFAKRYDSLNLFYPLFLKIVITTILLQLISLVLYIFQHNILYIYTPICLMFITLSCILTASVNRINYPEEKTRRKIMNIYCWVINILLLTLNILPYIILCYNYYTFSYYIIVVLVASHIMLFILGRFYSSHGVL